ncbi:MAG TPA: hypothetical protein VML55_08190 [Planctomycetaceae bacterium]|nr:hypothetical protein [Planctomycetaceae bacterium]
MSPLPFTIPFAGWLAKADGLLRFDGTALLLEFESRDALVGLLKTDLREIRIPVAEINAIELNKGLFSTTLEVQTSTLRATRGIPASSHGKFALTLSRTDRPSAEMLVAAMRAVMTGGPRAA